jgi:hypothetical protein
MMKTSNWRMDVRSAINKYKKNMPALQTYVINVKELGGNIQLRGEKRLQRMLVPGVRCGKNSLTWKTIVLLNALIYNTILMCTNSVHLLLLHISKLNSSASISYLVALWRHVQLKIGDKNGIKKYVKMSIVQMIKGSSKSM